MQKHKFSITCPAVLFVQSIPVPSEHRKYCADVSCLRRTRMHYVTGRSHQMQKYTFGVMCPDALFVESILVAPEYEK
jgi:hypothetical protein